MKNIKFTQDYRGKLTAEEFFQAGDVGSFHDTVADQLVADGRGVHTNEKPRRLADEQAPEGAKAAQENREKEQDTEDFAQKQEKAVKEAESRSSRSKKGKKAAAEKKEGDA